MSGPSGNAAGDQDRWWTAHDFADAYGYTVDWAWHRIRGWLKAGRIEVVGHERLTWARQFDRQKILDLCAADAVTPRECKEPDA